MEMGEPSGEINGIIAPTITVASAINKRLITIMRTINPYYHSSQDTF